MNCIVHCIELHCTMQYQLQCPIALRCVLRYAALNSTVDCTSGSNTRNLLNGTIHKYICNALYCALYYIALGNAIPGAIHYCIPLHIALRCIALCAALWIALKEHLYEIFYKETIHRHQIIVHYVRC